ncbi:MAG TPA: bifunctional hydroxymethylpyrimidine kinase/phosphomethylpyrimidine kinase [Pyrinomonadaceae bacterium]|nr:bifunctional hydroxymethylpyrimidine kinase/phosphomethylpyrimidine kinase [Pyrinomonadaceae bacterium]
MKVVLTIAGLDPSGGAGIVADIKTISALGCFPAAALTSITYQNTTGVFGAETQSAATLRSQVEPVIRDLAVAAAKTGMLPTAEIVAEVARLFSEESLPAPVVDPVMVSTSGHDLIGDEAFQILKTRLLPVARVVTPNIPEAERLAGFSIQSEDDMRRAAEAIRSLGARAVLVKGGHRAINDQAMDLLLDDTGRFVEFREEYLDVGEIHGSGCTLSAAIAASLANGMELQDAVAAAKSYITERIRALRTAPRIGHGALPI